MASDIKTLGKRGEIVIPKKIRVAAGLDEKTRIKIIRTSRGIVLIPLKKSFADFAGLLGSGGYNKKELDDAMWEIAGMG
ncbi:AbrB/MazE/SpoVT family DNA-binding domain-containing protein [Candidatus Woesearchaeota archaeon]|nr:AbrB/MazE/SpoVT family DNA-binding domain-containing protein [Candidatus Woesearchaeota archaeon]